MAMTPNDIDVLIHYYASPEKHPRVTASAVQQAIDKFVADGIFEIITSSTNGISVTEKGTYFIKMILDTPYPVRSFIDPRQPSLLQKGE